MRLNTTHVINATTLNVQILQLVLNHDAPETCRCQGTSLSAHSGCMLISNTVQLTSRSKLRVWFYPGRPCFGRNRGDLGQDLQRNLSSKITYREWRRPVPNSAHIITTLHLTPTHQLPKLGAVQVIWSLSRVVLLTLRRTRITIRPFDSSIFPDIAYTMYSDKQGVLFSGQGVYHGHH